MQVTRSNPPPIADLNMDGVVNSTDSGLWSDLIYSASNASVYAGTDLDFDGLDDWNSGGADGDLFYESYNENLGLSGVGRVSSPGVDSRTGYAGYQWDQTLSAYHVRYRVYLPDIGRWTRCDPLGDPRAASEYGYVAGSSLRWADSWGLRANDVGFTKRCDALSCTKLRKAKPEEDEFLRRVLLPRHKWSDAQWQAVSYCESGLAKFCMNCDGFRRAFQPARIPGNKKLDPSEEAVDHALGLILDCVVAHEKAHVRDLICREGDGFAYYTRLGYRSGSREASENLAYSAERACLERALDKCGDDFYCQKAVIWAMRKWNTDSRKFSTEDAPLHEFDIEGKKRACGWGR